MNDIKNDPRIRLLTLNRPDKYNSLTLEMIEELIPAFRAEDAVQVILLKGAGNNFCTGADLKGDVPKIFEGIAKLYKVIHSSTKIVISLVDGYCLAGGFGLVAASDLLIATPNATFSLPETRRGLLAPLAAAMAEHALPKRILQELTLTAEPMVAERLYQIGFINQLVPPDTLEESGYKMAHNILKGGPQSIKLTKRMLSKNGTSLKESLEWQFKALATGEPAEGLLAFREKRPPKWETKPQIT